MDQKILVVKKKLREASNDLEQNIILTAKGFDLNDANIDYKYGNGLMDKNARETEKIRSIGRYARYLIFNGCERSYIAKLKMMNHCRTHKELGVNTDDDICKKNE